MFLARSAPSAPVETPTEPAALPDGMRQVALRCLSEARASDFADLLMSRGVVVDEVCGDTVVIAYGGSVEFLCEVTTEAVLGIYADGREMADLLVE